MTKIDTFGDYVQRRLDHWGTVFALHRDVEYLGYARKNMLQVLIDHKGEMPPPNVGYKPMEIDKEAQQIEDIVLDIARDHPEMACALRAMYCGRGRYSVERFETAQQLIAACTKLPPLTRRSYYALVGLGEAQVNGMLRGMSRRS